MKSINKMTRIIGICGPSCSGKSYVSKKLLKYFPDSNRINADMYFKKDSTEVYKGIKNYDTPESINFKLLIKAVKKLKQGKPAFIIEKIHSELPNKELQPKEYLFVEGILIFANSELAALFDSKIFLDITDENLLKRRTERGRSKYDTNLDYIKNIVIKHAHEYKGMQKSEADIIIDANHPKEKVLEDVLSFLKSSQ